MSWGVGKQAITWVDRSGGAYGTDGAWTGETEVQAEIKATVNPIPGSVLLTLPEGERAEKNLRVLTTQEMATPDDYDDDSGDHVIVRGERYEIRDVQVYEKVIPHFEYRVRRIRPIEAVEGFALNNDFGAGFS